MCTRRGYPGRPEPLRGTSIDSASVTTPLADRFGRVATDLRVSLTDRCNLRCNYCMPAEGLDWLPTDQTLTDDEVVRLITIGVEQLGIREVRFTGGEPLLRRGLVDIVARTHALGVETSLTTNALGLTRTAQALADAGLDRINASIDTVRPETFATITRRDRLKDVVAGPRGGQGRRARPDQAQRRAAARHQRRPGRRAAALGGRARLRAALHRADAARRPARLEPDGDGDRRRDLRAAHRRVHPDPARRAARQRARRALRRRRRPGHRRHHRLGHPPVLRRLRPRTPHRRRPGPQLPLRPRGVRPPYGAALRRDRRRRSPSAGSSRCSASAPVTASTT